MMRLNESAAGLVLAYPVWVGIVASAIGLVLAFYVKRRFAWNGKMVSMAMGASIALFGGVYFLTYKAALTPEGARAGSIFKSGGRIAWTQVASATLEERPGKGRPTWLVLRGMQGEAVEIQVTDLAEPGRQKMMLYVEARRAGAR